jgi:hypothetical protein
VHKKDSYKIDNNPAIYNYIIEKLEVDKCSPEVISLKNSR